MKLNNIKHTPTVADVWQQWKKENPKLTDPIVVNNGYCAEFVLEIVAVIPKAQIWSNFHPGFEHAFVEINGKFYDAEAINGVTDYRKLPIWDRISILEQTPVDEITSYCQPVSLKTLCNQYGFAYPPRKEE